MTALADVYDALVDSLEDVFGLTAVRGAPQWGREALAPPALAVLIASVGLPPRMRAGNDGGYAHEFQVGYFGEDEVDLAGGVDTMKSWLAGNRRLDVGGRALPLGLSDGRRHPNENGVDQEDYAFVFVLSMTF